MASSEAAPAGATADEAAPPPDLPANMWAEVIRRLPHRHRFCAAMVCAAWREHALALLTPQLKVVLLSDAAAVGFGGWLAAHGHRLTHLTITEHYFSQHGPHQQQQQQQQGGGGGGGSWANVAEAVGSVQQAAAWALTTRVGPAARVQLWQGLAGRGRPVARLQSLTVLLDDLTAVDAVALGLVAMPALQALRLESNASSIGVTGTAGLIPLTSLASLRLPTQGIGDQGLQIIGSHLVGLRELSVHNDGHVSDDGLASLSGLAALTSLDLQGNVSITHGAMPGLAAALPHLLHLNLAWCAMVDDWGLGQLGPLSQLRELNLCATGVQAASPAASQALPRLTALSCLDLSHCAVGQPGLARVAALPALRRLNLAHNRGMSSFAELAPLRAATGLTWLDVSWPRKELRLEDEGLSELCSLTQLRHLAARYVMPVPAGGKLHFSVPWHPWNGKPEAFTIRCNVGDHSSAHTQLWAHAHNAALRYQAAAAAARAAALAAGGMDAPQGAGPVPELVPTQWAGTPSRWQELLAGLPRLAALTALEFEGNLSPWREGVWFMDQPALLEGALLLLGFAMQQQQPQLQLLDIATACEVDVNPYIAASAMEPDVRPPAPVPPLAATPQRVDACLQQLGKFLLTDVPELGPELQEAFNGTPCSLPVSTTSAATPTAQQQQQQAGPSAPPLKAQLSRQDSLEVLHRLLPSLTCLRLLTTPRAAHHHHAAQAGDAADSGAVWLPAGASSTSEDVGPTD